MIKVFSVGVKNRAVAGESAIMKNDRTATSTVTIPSRINLNS